jgi:hypothetical protein
MTQLKESIIHWYCRSTDRIVLLFLVIVLFTLIIVYVPYLNVLILPSLGGLIVFSMWYILFPPTVRSLVYVAIGMLCISFGFTVIGIHSFAERIGNILYLLIVFIFITLFRSFIRRMHSKNTP